MCMQFWPGEGALGNVCWAYDLKEGSHYQGYPSAGLHAHKAGPCAGVSGAEREEALAQGCDARQGSLSAGVHVLMKRAPAQERQV